jgi:hypothetical protein
MTNKTPTVVAQLTAIAAHFEVNKDQYSPFETAFLSVEKGAFDRVKQYGEQTIFTEKQQAIIGKIHAEKVLGIKPVLAEKSTDLEAVNLVKKLDAALSIANAEQFSDWERNYIQQQFKAVETHADNTQFSSKSIDILNRIHKVLLLTEN